MNEFLLITDRRHTVCMCRRALYWWIRGRGSFCGGSVLPERGRIYADVRRFGRVKRADAKKVRSPSKAATQNFWPIWSMKIVRMGSCMAGFMALRVHTLTFRQKCIVEEPYVLSI
jgi:hypothetical protein